MKKEIYSFNQIKFTADSKNIDHFRILDRAFNLNMLDIEDEQRNLLYYFIKSIKDKGRYIKSQLYQDVFADFLISNRFDKTFLEFGATDGLELSNTHFLENYSDWRGVLGEPDPQWHKKIKKNRPNTKIITECIWKKSNEKIEFLSSENGVLSTISSFRYSDKDTMYNNSELRNKLFKTINLKTISLNDLIKREFNEVSPSYISVDTEGSEYEILKNFNFSEYKPIFFSIEHNYTDNQKKIDDLLLKNNYIRVFRKITSFDAWYIQKKVLNKFLI